MSTITNPLRTISRTFQSILADINTDTNLIDKPDWFKRLIAGLGDVLSIWLNAAANQSYLRTAFTRQAVTDLVALIDYAISEKSTSSGTVLFYLDADAVAYPKTILKADLIAHSEGTTANPAKRFEGRSNHIQVATSEFFTAAAVTDLLTVARIYTTGEKVRVSTDNTLPDPLLANTDYYVVYVSDTTIKLSTSIANAYAGTIIDLLDAGVGNHTITLHSAQVTCYQQTAIEAYVAGTSDAVTEWQEFDLADIDVIADTLFIVINAVGWTSVSNFIDSGAADKHYKLIFKTDGSSKIQFGDGVYGAIPGAFDIYAEYAYGGGSNANVNVLNRINVYGGTDSDVSGVSNPTTFTGGGESESIESAKRLAPILLKTRERFVSTPDGEALAENYAGVSFAKVNKNVYGILSAQVLIVPNGGGLPSAILKTAVQTDLINRSILESIVVLVIDPTYMTQGVTLSAKILLGYTYADIETYIKLALRLFFSEVTKEIIDMYNSTGIADAVTFINSHWTESYTNEDYTQIQKLLLNVTPAEFGKDVQESEVLGFINYFVDGVDYCIIAAPAFPIVIAADEITTDGVMNLSEIV